MLSSVKPAIRSAAQVLCLLAFGSVMSGVQAQQMSIPGQFAVSETGAATYTIPIQVPPGVGGMEPKLALVYNSQSGNGLLGVGWSLSGLSAITRCPRTMAQDGVRGGVNYDLNDRYCLDGQRLILVSGTEGGNGAEYRTERESFSKIVAYTDPSNTGGPAKFLVKTKAGLTMEYGYTADSRIEAQGKTVVRAWALNKASDTKGNYQTIGYTETNASGEFYCNSIAYGGVGQATVASANFIYEARSDVISGFMAGSSASISKRLSSITASVDGVLQQSWQISYVLSQTSPDRSLVAKVHVCDSANNCLADTVFNSNSGNNYSFSDNPIPVVGINGSPDKVVQGDFNGDGLTDVYFFWLTTGQNRLYLRKRDGTFELSPYPIASSGINGSPDSVLTGDFNGDGRLDLYFIWASTGQNRLYLGDGIGGFSSQAITTSILAADISGYPDNATVDDFNADGRSDIYFTWKTSGKNLLYYGRADAGFDKYTNPVPVAEIYSSPDVLLTGDFNGDGLSDVVFTWKSGPNKLYLSNGSGGLTRYDNPANLGNYPISMLDIDQSPDTVVTGDFNGDGLSDLCFFWKSSGENRLFLSQGLSGSVFRFSGFSNPIPAAEINGSPDQIMVGDFNGDGLSDILFTWKVSGQNRLYVSTGSGGFVGYLNPAPMDATAINGSPDNLLIGDFNGDGISDVYFTWKVSGNNRLFDLGKGRPARLANMVPGVGGTVTLNLSPLTGLGNYTDGFYFKGTSWTYPQVGLQGPMYVVAGFSTTDGVGGVRQVNYRYGAARAEVGTGRGFLGFRWVQREDVSTGLTSRTWYRQDWPYVGLVDKVESGTTLANHTNLGLTTYTYDCTDFDSTAGCASASGKRYFPYATRVDEQSWDLNGVALPITRTDSVYDCTNTSTACFGNALDVTVSTLNADGSASGYSKRTQSQFYNDSTNWILGRLLKSSVIHATP